jgi:hypothetical protein
MRARGAGTVVVRGHGVERDTVSVLGSLDAGYVRRGDALMPRQGRRAPWKVLNNYLRDWLMLRWWPVADRHLEFRAAVAERTGDVKDAAGLACHAGRAGSGLRT